jgi:hypothetical protein
MTYFRWTIRIIFFGMIALLLHYNLPDRDIVRIVNTEVRRVDFGTNGLFWQNSGAGDAINAQNRDVLFIETIRPNGKPRVYRNEDTGWGWPPFFKFDTADLQAQAKNLESTEANPQWVALRHYGWRNNYFSIFPNALSLKPVAGPEVTLIPWFTIVFCTLLALLIITVWRLLRNFRKRRIEPVFNEIDEGAEAARGRFWRLFGRR